MAIAVGTGVWGGINVLLSHPLQDLLSNELKDGALQHICLGVTLQHTRQVDSRSWGHSLLQWALRG